MKNAILGVKSLIRWTLARIIYRRRGTIKKLTLVIIGAALSLSGCKNSLSPAFDIRLQNVRERVIRLIADGKAASMSIAVSKDGKIIWEESFGWADLENKIRATPHTKYLSGSVAKTITATGLMTLLEKGLVDLDKSLPNYVPHLKIRSFIGEEKEITVRHVLNHRSGIPSGGEGPGSDNFMRLIPAEDMALVVLCNTEIGNNLNEIQEEICAALIPGFAKVAKEDQPSNESADAQEIPDALLGKWKGEIVAYDREIEVELTVDDTEGAKISLPGQPESKMDLAVVTDDFLLGNFPGVIPTPDANRHPEKIRIAIVRQENRLSGQITAVQWIEERQMRYELSSWIEFNKLQFRTLQSGRP